MCFKKKKKIGVTYSEDRKTLLLAAQEVEVLMVLDRNKLYEEELKSLKDALLYTSPRDNQEVFDMDLKIRDKVGDLKLILNKDNDIHDDNIEKIIQTMFVMIKEREAKELK